MIFKHLLVGPLDVNCFILGCEKTKESIVIDPGGNVQDIIDFLTTNHLKLKYILCTHSHFDHIGGNKQLKDFTGAKIAIHKDEADSITNISSTAALFGMKIDNSPEADILLNDGDKLYVGEEITLTTIHTPGHSSGSSSFLLENSKIIFVGDTLFAGSIGRTDLPGGDFSTLINSVKKNIFTLPDETTVLPGHGPDTSVGEEKRHNPFF